MTESERDAAVLIIVSTEDGVSQRQITKWESGSENVSVDAIDRVAAALGLRVRVSLVAA